MAILLRRPSMPCREKLDSALQFQRSSRPASVLSGRVMPTTIHQFRRMAFEFRGRKWPWPQRFRRKLEETERQELCRRNLEYMNAETFVTSPPRPLSKFVLTT